MKIKGKGNLESQSLLCATQSKLCDSTICLLLPPPPFSLLPTSWYNKPIMAGKYFEELPVGYHIKHHLGRTMTEMDNVLFCALTMNPQPLHINEDFAQHTAFGQRIVNGILTLGLAVGLTVGDLTDGTLVANLGYEQVVHPHPMFHGDTLYVETEVISQRESHSKPQQGIVRFRHTGRNQHGVVVITFERTALMWKKGGQVHAIST